MKPIKKETITALTSGSRISALGAILLSGAIVVTASGCTAEVKADGITIESLLVSGSGENFNADINVDAPKGTVEAKATETALPDGIGKQIGEQGKDVSTESSGSVPD